MKIIVAIVLFLVGAGSACRTKTDLEQLDREQAPQIARAELSFEPVSQEAEKIVEDGRALWRITFRGKPLRRVTPGFRC